MAGSGDDWANDRLKTSYQEARNVIDAQQDTMSDIDTKAVYTVRLTVLLTGIVVGAARIAGPSIFNPDWFKFGVILLLISIIAGVFTYTESNLFLGPNRTYLLRLTEGDVEAKSWDADLINRLADWIDDNHEDIIWNGRLLFAAQCGLALGVIAITLAIAF